MRYWLDLFTPETWTRFHGHGSDVSGFALTMRDAGSGDSTGRYLRLLSHPRIPVLRTD